MTHRAILPISLYLTAAQGSRPIVLVGDGSSARARAEQLRAVGAQLVQMVPADFTPEHCEGAFMVMAHSDDRALDQRVATTARAAGCLCYAHDQPDFSDFAMPALVRRGPLTLAISTRGQAPALARRFRVLLQDLLDQAGTALDDLVASMIETRGRLPSGSRAAPLGALARRLSLVGALQIASPRADDTTPPPA